MAVFALLLAASGAIQSGLPGRDTQKIVTHVRVDGEKFRVIRDGNHATVRRSGPVLQGPTSNLMMQERTAAEMGTGCTVTYAHPMYETWLVAELDCSRSPKNRAQAR